MQIPYIYPLTEAKARLGHLVSGVAASEHGPVLLGRRGVPDAALVAWADFDELRDELGALEAGTHVDVAAERVQHPSGPTTAPLSDLAPSIGAGDVVTFWPDLVTDLREHPSEVLADVLVEIASGGLHGTPFARGTLGPQWRWFLVTENTDGPTGWHVIWRTTDDDVELVAALPISPLLHRTWRAGPEPE
ncbi:type II toxin-antitoxin system prevent-host-death family antitoxin [Luteimicrobium sp. DT211]|uniref:type II toxin-antitoxin system prevent-host-death family antitoxin n=1 Tax=Luteimicrobium sp. DT211 TaxID=3393412 RepID=UPI003CF683DC